MAHLGGGPTCTDLHHSQDPPCSLGASKPSHQPGRDTRRVLSPSRNQVATGTATRQQTPTRRCSGASGRPFGAVRSFEDTANTMPPSRALASVGFRSGVEEAVSVRVQRKATRRRMAR